METSIKIGDELFYANLAEYVMVDQTLQLEGRITKVKIEGIYLFKDATPKYLFKIGGANVNSEEKQLFKVEQWAREYIKQKLAAVPVLVDLQEPVKDITEAIKKWPVQE